MIEADRGDHSRAKLDHDLIVPSLVTCIKLRGGTRYLDGIRYVKIRTTGLGASERKPEDGPEHLMRWGP